MEFYDQPNNQMTFAVCRLIYLAPRKLDTAPSWQFLYILDVRNDHNQSFYLKHTSLRLCTWGVCDNFVTNCVIYGFSFMNIYAIFFYMFFLFKFLSCQFHIIFISVNMRQKLTF